MQLYLSRKKCYSENNTDTKAERGAMQTLTQGEHPSLQREGYKNATAYIPVKGHYGRSYTADRW